MAGPGKRGRPHKGDRRLVTSRLPLWKAEHVADLAEERGENRSDFIHALINIGLAHLDELPEPVISDDDQQGRLDLVRAS